MYNVVYLFLCLFIIFSVYVAFFWAMVSTLDHMLHFVFFDNSGWYVVIDRISSSTQGRNMTMFCLDFYCFIFAFRIEKVSFKYLFWGLMCYYLCRWQLLQPILVLDSRVIGNYKNTICYELFYLLLPFPRG